MLSLWDSPRRAGANTLWLRAAGCGSTHLLPEPSPKSAGNFVKFGAIGPRLNEVTGGDIASYATEVELEALKCLVDVVHQYHLLWLTSPWVSFRRPKRPRQQRQKKKINARDTSISGDVPRAFLFRWCAGTGGQE